MNKNSNFPVSDHCDGYYFFNPSGARPKGLLDVLKWKFNGQRKPWLKWVENKLVPQPANHSSNDEIILTFINHATLLIQTAGLNILTDPVFSNRVSPFQHIGPKRVRRAGLALEQLPKIDVVLVSHNHYDHMDLTSLRRLEQRFQPQFITPLGNGTTLKTAGIMNVLETDWWQTIDFHATKLITVPAQHWSGRGLKDRNRALWAGFVIQTPKNKIYFAGDTGYGPHFKQIRERLGSIDLALLPIGAYEPRWFMHEHHMNPEDAVLAHLDLNAKVSVGMHFGSFQLTDEGFDEPVEDLKIALQKHNVANFITLEVGETHCFKTPQAEESS